MILFILLEVIVQKEKNEAAKRADEGQDHVQMKNQKMMILDYHLIQLTWTRYVNIAQHFNSIISSKVL